MNREEIGQLLTKAAMIDNRVVTPALIQAWHELLRGLDYADAKAALDHHRMNSAEYLVPAHIVAGVKRIRARRLELSIATALPPAELDGDAAATRRWLTQKIAAIADGRYVNRVLGLPAGRRRPGPPPSEFQQTRTRMEARLKPSAAGCPTRRQPSPPPSAEYERARDALAKLPNFGHAYVEAARAELGADASPTQLVIHAANLARRTA